MRQDVMLTIRGEQRYEGQEPEVIELVTEGILESMGDGAWRLSYEESDLTGLQGTTTMFHVRPGYVVLSRTGTVQSEMIFEEGVRHDSLYQLDVGALMICVCAKRIRADLSENGGKLDVLYTVTVEQTMAGTVRYQISVRPLTYMGES